MTVSAPAAASRALAAMATPEAAARRLRRFDEIEALDRVASLDEVCGHRRAHIAEADEGDVRHGSSRTPGAVLVFKLGDEGGVIRAS